MTKDKTNNRNSPSAIAWRRFRKNYSAMAGLIWLLICIFVAVFAYPLMPDNTENANFQIVELAKQPPGTNYTLILEPSKNQIEQGNTFANLFSGRKDQFRPIPVSSPESIQMKADSLHYVDTRGFEQHISLVELMLPIDKYSENAVKWKATGGKPYLLQADEITYQDLEGKVGKASLSALAAQFQNENIQKGHFWLGSDAFGRDQLSRLLLGTRVSLGIGLMAVIVSLLLGLSLGALAGYFRGRVDQVIMWFVSVVWSIPTLLLAISLAFVLGKGTWQLFLAIGVSSWVEVARIVRGQFFSLREMQFVEATKAMGFKWPRTIGKHILPNILSPLIIVAAANFATAILMEAGLSFLGVGIQPPVPSWGGMIKDGYTQIMFDSGAWLAIFPGLAIVLVVISLNLVGFGLRDAFDPKQEQ